MGRAGQREHTPCKHRTSLRGTERSVLCKPQPETQRVSEASVRALGCFTWDPHFPYLSVETAVWPAEFETESSEEALWLISPPAPGSVGGTQQHSSYPQGKKCLGREDSCWKVSTDGGGRTDAEVGENRPNHGPSPEVCVQVCPSRNAPGSARPMGSLTRDVWVVPT